MAVRAGRYETIRAIASGGMATVHLGRALGAGGFERLVAIKVMHAHLAEEPEFVAMFLDEARLAARIRHPNVVSTIDIQQDEEGLFLVMEYVEGPSLQRLLRTLAKKKLGPPPLDLALRIFLDALGGLHAAHELTDGDGAPLHLVHRDVSPQNVLLGLDGVAKITDFGVARAGTRVAATRAGVVKGKVCYMAPEQIRSEPIDRRTDVYAAGALLWELLTGQRLVRGDTEAAMMDRILRAEIPSPCEVNPLVPEAIAAVCLRALSASIDDRHPTAAALAEALEAAAAQEGVTIAAARAVAIFLKGLDPVDPTAPQLSSTSRSLDRPASASTPAPPLAQPVSAATAIDPPSQAPLSTNAAVLARPSIPEPRRSGALRWLIAGAAGLVVVAGVLVSVGPLRISWGDHGAAAPAASAPAVREPAAASVSASATASVSASATASVSASAPASASGAPRPAAPRKEPGKAANPAQYRPREL